MRQGGGVGDGDVPAPGIAAGGVVGTDLPEVCDRNGDAGFFLQLAGRGHEAGLAGVHMAALRKQAGSLISGR